MLRGANVAQPRSAACTALGAALLALTVLTWDTPADRWNRAHAYHPWVDLGALFDDVQRSGIFADSKTFVDAIPLRPPAELAADYARLKGTDSFDLKGFVEQRFRLPAAPPDPAFNSDQPFAEHLRSHWRNLVRSDAGAVQPSTLVPLPNRYVVPGGRFREIYYWDSYFTMIGLGVSGEIELLEAMLDNFAHLIDIFGFIPNGNRTYYEGRSQPPFFAAMVNLYSRLTSLQRALKYLPALRREYQFWMDGHEGLSEAQPSHRRTVLHQGVVLNRYWDDYDLPRPESHREDVALAQGLPAEARHRLYRELRAGAESGWDYSSRWFAELDDFASIRTTAILPVDLNSLMFNMETVLAALHGASGEEAAQRLYVERAETRRAAINALFWNAEAGMYQDILWRKGRFSGHVTAASFYPMYLRAASPELAKAQAPRLLNQLLDDGGILATTHASGQQWDKPNGWAPLQWIAVKGLLHYGFPEEAGEIAHRWLAVNRRVFADTGKMMEKYNVSDLSLTAGGGEYPAQDGFGWTNGVALGLLAEASALAPRLSTPPADPNRSDGL